MRCHHGSQSIELLHIVIVGISDGQSVVKILVVGETLHAWTSVFRHVVALAHLTGIRQNGTKGCGGRTIAKVISRCGAGAFGTPVVPHTKVVSNLVAIGVVARGTFVTDDRKGVGA
jgi:hypothetical protein